ncbi:MULTISPECIES: methyltransferase domain-containing protein [unclassified Haloarcula]|uniref:methyltransferase domain-containing protein n=1 Tax=unclassified Haloarcula TaxID=2624677 RepID=UPI000EF20723|nr:methyltransferase domain-containing protein [Haloarcula sp. Atlit-120R]RLM47150.1 methyltransferase domain-containing protein [Haloarcula sp. Atlit-47R]
MVGTDLKPTVGERAAGEPIRDDLFPLSFADGIFDGVVFAEVPERLPNPGDAIPELATVLETGGRPYLTRTRSACIATFDTPY